MPLVGAYYVQSGSITTSALLASLPIGLYTTAVLYFHHFLHWRADAEVGKVTPIVALGERNARIVGAVMLLLIAFTVILDASLQVFPWYSFLAAFTVLPVLQAVRQATGDLKRYLKLMAANMNGNLLAGLIIFIALLVRGIFHV